MILLAAGSPECRAGWGTDRELAAPFAAAVSQAAISPLNATGSNVSNSTGNVANVRTVTLSPYWTHRFGDCKGIFGNNARDMREECSSWWRWGT